MRIINISVIRSGIIDEIISFGVYDEDEACIRKAVAKAEALFIEKAIELGYDEDNDGDIEDHLDNGYFEVTNKSVCLTWTEITPLN